MPAPVVEWIRSGVGFQPDAAASFRRAEASWGRPIDVNSTYRDYEQQQRMFDAWNRYVASGYNPKMHPGHSRALDPRLSFHCLALALDSDDWRTPGFIAHMARHGWIRTAANDPTEQHHFEYKASQDRYFGTTGSPAGVGGVTDIPRQGEDSMAQITEQWLNGGFEEVIRRVTSATSPEALLSTRISVRGGTATVTVREALQRTFDVYDAIFVGGESMPDNGRSLAESIDGIVDVVDRIDGREAAEAVTPPKA